MSRIQPYNSPSCELSRWLKVCMSLLIALFASAVVVTSFHSSAIPAAAQTSGKPRGQDAFEKRCTGCHSLDQDKEGPRLRGIYSAKAATLSNTFEYSTALKNSNVTWNDATLDQWMDDAEKLAPGTDMFFRVPKAEERADIVAYLKQLANK